MINFENIDPYISPCLPSLAIDEIRKELKSLEILNVLNVYGLNIERRPLVEIYKADCPFCFSEGSSLLINLDMTRYQCLECGKTGNCDELVKECYPDLE